MIAVSNRQRVDWYVPADEWDRFVEHVHDEHGEIEGYVGRAVEHAMREFTDQDGYGRAEELVDRLVAAAGRRPSDLTEKKTPTLETFDATEGDTTRVTCRVDPDVRTAFKQHADQNFDQRLGVVLARALRSSRLGGRANRLEEKLDRVVDDCEAILGELTGDDTLSTRERRTVAIIDTLRPETGELAEFTRDDLNDAIAAVAGDSRPTLEAYTERVLSRLEYVEHPNNDALFIPEDQVSQCDADPDALAVDRLDWPDLSREQKVHGLQVRLAAASTARDGKLRWRLEDVREVFGSYPPDNSLYSLMQAADDAEGYRSRNHHGSRVLEVTLEDVTDPEILGEIDRQPSAGSPSPATTTTSQPRAATDGGRTPETAPDEPSGAPDTDVDEQFAALEAAHPSHADD